MNVSFDPLDLLTKIITVVAIMAMGIVAVAAIDENTRKENFNKRCIEAGGIPLAYTIQRTRDGEFYTCLSASAILKDIH